MMRMAIQGAAITLLTLGGGLLLGAAAGFWVFESLLVVTMIGNMGAALTGGAMLRVGISPLVSAFERML